MLAVGLETTLEIIPLSTVIAKLGRFREPNILIAETPTSKVGKGVGVGE